MSEQRRKWKAKLRDDCCIEKTPKKAKVQILHQDIYKEQEGKLVLLNSLNYYNNNEHDQEHKNEKLNDVCMQLENETVTTPVQKLKDNNTTVKNLTPTFRNPENYLAATAEFLKDISPILGEDQDNANGKVNQPYSITSDRNLVDFEGNNNNFDNPVFNIHSEIQETTEMVLDNFNYSNSEKTVSFDTNDGREKVFNTFTEEICIESSIHEEKLNEINKNRNKTLANEYIKAVEETKNTQTTMASDGKNGAILNDNHNEIVMTTESKSAQFITREKVEPTKKVRSSKRKLNFNKSYLDFIADDDPDTLLLNEAFPSEESNVELSEVTTSSSDSECNNPKKDKKKKMKTLRKSRKRAEIVSTANKIQLQENIKPKTKVKKENNDKKNKGEEYMNAKGDTVEKKQIRPNPCANCINNCKTITEERRLSLFQHFWGLSNFQRRKDWIAQCATRKAIKRPTKDSSSGKSQRFEYFINDGEGRRKVCQSFLINTLDITQRFILYTLDTASDGFAKQDGRGNTGGYNKTSEDIVEDANNFILSLPLLPSHYCRRDSTKLYLPEEFKNITNLHRVYQAHFKGNKTMSFKVFSGWFSKKFNIGFHVPKKDKCSLCTSAKTYNCKTEEEMNKIIEHNKEKEESYNRFKFHQKLNRVDKSTVCASFDLQKVLNTPYGASMLLYYSRKIAVYNLTIYESNTQLGICNIWTEADAKRGSNEIASCLLGYIKEVDKRGCVKQVILYCDSCFGQNKNKTVLAMLRFALTICKNINNIQINYLVPGHTYMPVDSMHATIENSVRKTIVWAPSQWPTIMELARKNPSPYVVNVMNGKDFLGFERVVDHTFNKNQCIKIAKISTVSFHKKHLVKMFIKTSMLPQTEAVEIQLGSINNVFPKPALYPSKLPISQKKFHDLKKMIDKNSIPERFATEYLSFKTSTKVSDCLPDTDEDD